MKQLLLIITLGFTLQLCGENDKKTSKGYNIGDVAIGFELINVDDTKVSLKQYEAAKGFIIVFTCNHCPFSVKYEDRIIELDKKYKPLGYPVIAISPNDVEAFPEDDLANMKIRSEEKGFTFPYLYDETQEIAKSYGATKTPHVFLLNKEMQEKESTNGKDIEEKYVEMAIEALQNGEAVDPNVTKAIGCSIKWKK